MSRTRIFDTIVIVIVIAAWVFYFLYEGATRLDINQIFTLPLLIATESTALAVLYAVIRYFSHKIKMGKLKMDQLLSTDNEEPPGKEGTTKSEDELKN